VVYPGPSVTDELSARGSAPSTAGAKWSLDVTPIVQSWIDGAQQRGIRLRRTGGNDVVFDSLQSADGKNALYLELQYGGSGTTPDNRKPNVPSNLHAAYGADGKSITVYATHTDPDGDQATKYEVRLVTD
jgi:hypothetical protein